MDELLPVLRVGLDILMSVFISAGFLWLGMKTAVVYSGLGRHNSYCDFKDLIWVATLPALVAYIPVAGFPLSIVLLFYLLMQVTEANFFEVIIMVYISRVAALVLLPEFMKLI